MTHPGDLTATTPPLPAPAPARRRTGPLVALVAGVAVLSAGLGAGSMWLAMRPTDGAIPAQSAGAVSACHDRVLQQLKSPGSAKFSADQVTENRPGAVVVTGQVDSENGFGALLRKRYRCDAGQGSDSAWSAQDVQLTDW